MAGVRAEPRDRYGLLLALAVTVVVWWSALPTWFTADDIVSLYRAAHLEPTPLLFRPLSAVIAWRLEYALFGLSPLGYHVVAFLLHCLNVLGVYAIAARLGADHGVATAAALLFGASGIAFTVLHAASSLGDLLALLLVLTATRVHLAARDRAHPGGLWLASALGLLAVLAKESALAWPLVIVAAELLVLVPPARAMTGAATSRTPLVLPALVAGLLGAIWTLATMNSGGMSARGAYELSLSPADLLANLSTYLRWIAQIGVPLRDWIAAPDRAAIPAGLLVLALLAAAWRLATDRQRQVRTGVVWLMGFLLPVLPLLHHSYLYYLYLPWAGGACTVAGALSSITHRFARAGIYVAVLLIAGFVIAEAAGARARERLTVAGLPADRTMRDAELLQHAISALRGEHLPDGVTVGFVNPIPARDVSLIPGDERAAAGEDIRPYRPLQSLMLDGKTLRLFFPTWKYAGFSDTIPKGWENVECFLFEQRGFLRRWGKGAEALGMQQEWMREHEPGGSPAR